MPLRGLARRHVLLAACLFAGALASVPASAQALLQPTRSGESPRDAAIPTATEVCQ